MKPRPVNEALLLLLSFFTWTSADIFDDDHGGPPRGPMPRGPVPRDAYGYGMKLKEPGFDGGPRSPPPTGDQQPQKYQRVILRCSEQHLRDPRGRITSPGYPDPIQANTCFKWSIHVQEGETLTLAFRDFHVSKQPGKTCTQGILEIGANPQRRICLNNNVDITPQVYESKETQIWIKLVSPFGADHGFMLDYIFDKVPRLTCEPGLKLCATGKCLPADWFCNGAQECGANDPTDETDCNRPQPQPILPVQPLRPPEPVSASCGEGRFMCVSRIEQSLQCFEDYKRCDGVVHCQNAEDERRCDSRTLHCGGFPEMQSGYITSPNYPKSYPLDKTCVWNIHVPAGKIIQVRFQSFDLSPENPMTGTSDYVEFRDGRGRRAKLLGRYTEQRRPPSVIETTADWLYVKFKTDLVGGREAIGFNFTHQIKGVCLAGQIKCSDEEDCYSGMNEQCDGIWHCRRHGWDERGCANCEADKYSCGSGGRCYTEEEHCNGRGSCFDNRDEKNCTPEQCNSGNGTYLCENGRCIYESWVCDGTNDCDDDSDERECVETPSIRVILAAVVGSLICGLLLVIALGCTLHMFAIRIQDQNAHYETPMSRIQAELMRRAAPPSYNEAMQTSVPFSEMLTHMRAAGRRLSRSWRAPEITPGAPLHVAPLIAHPQGTRILPPPHLTTAAVEQPAADNAAATAEEGVAALPAAETVENDESVLVSFDGNSQNQTETSLCEIRPSVSSESDVSLLEVEVSSSDTSTNDQSQSTTDDQALLLANEVVA